MNRALFGDVPFFLRIVQEKLVGWRPKVPQISSKGKVKSPKDRIQMSVIIRTTKSGL